MQVPHVLWRVQPVQSPCRMSSQSAAADSLSRLSAPSAIRSTWGSRPPLQMDAFIENVY
jgi:hypothetical protein